MYGLSMTWSLIVHNATIKNCSTVLQAFSSRFLSLFLCILYFLFHEGKDTSAILQPSVYHLAYVSPIFFCFHKYFNNFHLKVQSCKLYNSKYIITSTQITNTDILAFIAVLVLNLLSRKVLFINRKDNRN